ncbi:unnamed protein product [Camellia sinensis]
MRAIGGEELTKWEKMQGVASGGSEQKILVLVRLRPLSEKEIARNEVSDWECINETTILFRNSLQEQSMFPTAHTFDGVFSGDPLTRQPKTEEVKKELTATSADSQGHKLLCRKLQNCRLLMLILRPSAGVDVWIDVRIVVVLILRPSAAISPCCCLLPQFRLAAVCFVLLSFVQFFNFGVRVFDWLLAKLEFIAGSFVA